MVRPVVLIRIGMLLAIVSDPFVEAIAGLADHLEFMQTEALEL